MKTFPIVLLAIAAVAAVAEMGPALRGSSGQEPAESPPEDIIGPEDNSAFDYFDTPDESSSDESLGSEAEVEDELSSEDLDIDDLFGGNEPIDSMLDRSEPQDELVFDELDDSADPSSDTPEGRNLAGLCDRSNLDNYGAALSAMNSKWLHMGGTKGLLKAPRTDMKEVPGRDGYFRHFQGGSIYWHCKSGAHEVHGSIRQKWARMGWERSHLRYPTTDETTTPDRIGRFNHFQGGSIYWKPSLGAHEIYGLIRNYWAQNGWERNAALGYPISDELSTKRGSKNRYNDFENGVVFWKYGSRKAQKLAPLYMSDMASQSRAQIQSALNSPIRNLIGTGSVKIKRNPSITAVTDYSYHGGTVRNRQLKVRVSLEYEANNLPNPSTELDLWIEIRYNKSTRKVQYVLQRWYASTHVPWPTSWGIKAKDINAKLKKQIDPHLGRAKDFKSVPAGINILSLKVQKNGNLEVFVEPA